ncbi:MAG TPA: stage III sporulation protein AF [Paenibacillaceae bacterium]|nr:stage III sporulation protein AF [Paenibacillaceae bacterium]
MHMTILTLWVKKLILLVLLATFIELLLPTNAYQKYVRMAMGLLILLTLLTPLLEIFQKPISLNQLGDFYQTKENGQGIDMDRIQALSQQLVSYQDETTTEYVQTQIKDLVAKQVEEEYRVKVDAVDVKLKKDKEKVQSIDQIVVHVQHNEKQVASEGSENGEMKPMDPVNVDINLASPSTNSSSVPVLQEESPQLKKIQSGIATAWNLNSKQVFVKWKQTGEGKENGRGEMG